MTTIAHTFSKTVREHSLIRPGQTIVVAVSGGPDSLSLLHLTHALYPETTMHAVYVDHSLRPHESPAEQELIKAQCISMSVDLHVCTVDVPGTVAATGESVEACARRLRYEQLHAVMGSVGADAIAVGHTADDQAEEVLIRLIRGSGLKGLGGMDYQNGAIVRPLLDIDKSAIIDFLRDRAIPFCLDSTNDDKTFLRNRVRHDLLPLLEARFNPAIRKTLVKTAAILKDEDAYLQEQTAHFFADVVSSCKSPQTVGEPSLSVSCSQLVNRHPALQRRIAEQVLWQTGARPDSAAIESFLQLCMHGKSGSELHFSDRVRMVKNQDQAVVARLAPEQDSRGSIQAADSFAMEIPGPGDYRCNPLNKRLSLYVPAAYQGDDADLLLLDLDKIAFPLTLRTPIPGERFYPQNGQGSRKVSRYLNDRKIPTYLRSRYPVLVSKNKIVCVVGLCADERCSVTDQTARLLQLRWLDEPTV